MSDQPNGADETIALLRIQGQLAGAYDIARRTDHKFLAYLIKMARMEVHTLFDKTASALDDPGDVDWL